MKICGQSVDVGNVVACKYPLHGTRNVLKSRLGEIVAVGQGPKGLYITMKTGDEYRNLSERRIVDLEKKG
jgi:hypothetical protein